MYHPLLDQPQAMTRAKQLLAVFDRNPDALSPDEQALAQAIRALERTEPDVLQRVRVNCASMVQAMAESQYARDIRGDLARRQWMQLAAAIEKP